MHVFKYMKCAYCVCLIRINADKVQWPIHLSAAGYHCRTVCHHVLYRHTHTYIHTFVRKHMNLDRFCSADTRHFHFHLNLFFYIFSLLLFALICCCFSFFLTFVILHLPAYRTSIILPHFTPFPWPHQAPATDFSALPQSNRTTPPPPPPLPPATWSHSAIQCL